MQPPVICLAVTILCAVGLYAAIFMFDKERRARRGEVHGPSVVKTPQARLLGVPNAGIAIAYYPLLASVVWIAYYLHERGWVIPMQTLAWAALAATIAAGIMSVVLAFSLLFITKRWCPYCWTAHAVNWALVILLATAAISSGRAF